MYESFGWMSKFVDPGFIHHLAIGRLWAGHTLIAANANLIPYNVLKYSKQVKGYLEKFEATYKTLLDKHGVSMSTLICFCFRPHKKSFDPKIRLPL